MRYYMHTLGGAPAFYDGEQICFARRTIVLCRSMKQVLSERKKSSKWRKSQGWGQFCDYGVSYVEVPK